MVRETRTPTRYDRAAVDGISSEWLPAGSKGIPLASKGLSLGEFAASGINALGGELPLPLLVARESALEDNIASMAAYCASNEVLLAPHGKTTMAPQLFARQIDAGAWAITAATPSHLRVYRRFGIQRVFLANQLLEYSVIRWVSEEMRQDPEFEFFCLVDSIAGVRQLEESLTALGLPRPLQVLLEVGYPGGRAGVRDQKEAVAVAEAVASARHLQLVGLECYEGLMPRSGDSAQQAIESIDDWLEEVANTQLRLIELGLVTRFPLVSGGGSAYFDRVVAKLAGLPGQLVLRSGCYVTQDGGFYDAISPLAGRGGEAPRLRNALELWSTVLSHPEPGRAIAGFGKRDAPFDMGWPTPSLRRRSDGSEAEVRGAAVVAMNDQHTHLSLAADTELGVGDLLRCSISHPCGAFDRWRSIPVLDDDDILTDAIMTYF